MSGAILGVIDSVAILAGMLANGVRQRLLESGHGPCHHVVILMDPATGKAHCQSSLKGADLAGVLRDVANGATRR